MVGQFWRSYLIVGDRWYWKDVFHRIQASRVTTVVMRTTRLSLKLTI